MNDSRLMTYLNPLHVDYIEDLAQEYRDGPNTIDDTWRCFFDGMNLAHHESFAQAKQALSEQASDMDFEFELKVIQLIQAYRELGHLIADVNPLDRGIKNHPLLDLSAFGLSESDLNRNCHVGRALGIEESTLSEIINNLKSFYCSSATVEYGHIGDPRSRRWIQEHIEKKQSLKTNLPDTTKKRALDKLCEAEAFESFLHKRFVGQKRFSVEGCDAVIPMLDYLIEQAAELGANEVIMGMAHRGRLNVLTHVFQKNVTRMLAEFTGNMDVARGEGDVKYHMGFSQDVTTPQNKEVHLSLMPNPSHLEAINAVLMGVTRAKQTLKKDTDKKQTLPVIIHGDASFAGQGVIYETLNMSELKGYTIGGTIHIITNNQIGFTSNPHESRSTPNATDIAKMLEVPIFRVNADDPEACLRCIALALQFRYEFKRDVIIDLMGYRRYGHNESDEPFYTQPLMYQKIKTHPRVKALYSQMLTESGLSQKQDIDNAMQKLYAKMDAALTESKSERFSKPMGSFDERWKTLAKPLEEKIFTALETGIAVKTLKKIGTQMLELPESFNQHPKLNRFLQDRQKVIEENQSVNWSLGESLTYASLLHEGYDVRLAGQDSERGTFSHRHAVFHDVETGQKLVTFDLIKDKKADFEVVNSLLSEYAALGFEFGQSLANPKKLTIWEAQFGDFVNGAQIIIDQFLTSSADKWQRYSGLVMLLPHGYEGQGPEHSSGRVERFLQACAKFNIQVCNLTTPAQFFHAIRRQIHRTFRIPLVIMSPKSLLRHPDVVSSFEDFEKGAFEEVLDDPQADELKDSAERIILCSGKIYYELLKKRNDLVRTKAALIRMEQFYPFPGEKLMNLINAYPKVQKLIWCQEEPQNMGGWTFMLERLSPLLKENQKLEFIGRARQANPADGYLHLHVQEQKRIIQAALNFRINDLK